MPDKPTAADMGWESQEEQRKKIRHCTKQKRKAQAVPLEPTTGTALCRCWSHAPSGHGPPAPGSLRWSPSLGPARRAEGPEKLPGTRHAAATGPERSDAPPVPLASRCQPRWAAVSKEGLAHQDHYVLGEWLFHQLS